MVGVAGGGGGMELRRDQLTLTVSQSPVMLLLCSVLLSLAVARGAADEEFRVVYEWYKVDFTWKDAQAQLDAYSKKQYESKNNIIQNIKIWEDIAFLTLPRSKTGVPATLVTVPSVASKSPSASPRLEPFPTWAFQEVGNCASLQNVQAIEVDPDGFLWVADSGTVGEFKDFSDPDSKCPPKLVIFDIAKRELVSEFEFAKDFLRPATMLTDIVIDPRDNKTAYISAVNDYDACVIVYQNQTKSAIKVDLFPRVEPTSVVVNGTEVPLKLNKLSLALSVWQGLLYLNPSWEERLYSVDVNSLTNADFSSSLKPVGNLPGLSYAIVLDSKQVLYYTILEKDSISKWNTSKKFEEGHKIITQDKSFLQFPSSFAFDRSENLWVVTNRFQTYLSNDVNLEVPNFRLARAYTGSDSYLFAPQPSGSTPLVMSSLCFVVLLFLVVMR